MESSKARTLYLIALCLGVSFLFSLSLSCSSHIIPGSGKPGTDMGLRGGSGFSTKAYVNWNSHLSLLGLIPSSVK